MANVRNSPPKPNLIDSLVLRPKCSSICETESNQSFLYDKENNCSVNDLYVFQTMGNVDF